MKVPGLILTRGVEYFSTLHASLVSIPKFKLEWVLWGPRLVKIVPFFDLEINLMISLRFVCFRRAATWFSSSTSPSSIIITDFTNYCRSHTLGTHLHLARWGLYMNATISSLLLKGSSDFGDIYKSMHTYNVYQLLYLS